MKVKSMRGQSVDMGALVQRHKHTVALGNAAMNAAGDRIGPGGRIIKTHAAATAEYHAANPKAVKRGPLKGITDEILAAAPTPAELRAKLDAAKQDAAKKPPRKLHDD